MSHTHSTLMTDRVYAASRAAIFAVVMAVALQGVRDLTERKDAERRRPRCAWKA